MSTKIFVFGLSYDIERVVRRYVSSQMGNFFSHECKSLRVKKNSQWV